MKVENINEALRNMVHELTDDGFKKRHICGLTLGAQNEPQFEGFLKGSDFGLKPLQRLINNMGYNFHVIVIPDGDEEITKFVKEVNQEFITASKVRLVEKLGDENAVKSASVAKTGLIANVSSELFDAIVK